MIFRGNVLLADICHNCYSIFRLYHNPCAGLIKFSRNVGGSFISSSTRNASTDGKRKQVFDQMNVFDRKAKLLQRHRAALMEDFQSYEYLREEIGWRIADRIFDVKRMFDNALDLGCSRGYISRHMQPDSVGHVTLLDSCQALLDKAEVGEGVLSTKLLMDEEAFELEEETYDLVVSSMCLHWVNDLPGCFDRIMNCLKKDGVFIAALLGGDSLYELRSSLQLAELERRGGFSPRVSPLTRVRDVGGLLTVSGFTMLTVDTDDIEIVYPSVFELLQDLRGMGETGASYNRSLHLHRDTLMAASAIYNQLYSKELKTGEQAKQGVTATYQVIYLVGWKPDPRNPGAPLKPHVGDVSFRDIDKIDEILKKTGKGVDEDKNQKK